MNIPLLGQAKKTRSRLAGFMLAVTMAVTGLSGMPSPAAAQTDVNQAVRNTWDVVKEGMVTGVTSGLIDAANYFVSNMAYQLALSIMGDCPGQKSCWSTKNWTSVLKESAEGAAATAITSAADASGLTGLGFNVCNPALPGVNLTFQLGMLAEEKPAQPRCSFDQITTGWDNMVSNMKDKELASVLNTSFEPGQAPMSFGLSAFTYKYEKKQEDTRTKYEDWATNKIGAQGFSDVKDPVSGRTMTPGSLVAEQMKDANKKKTEGKTEATQGYTQSAIAAQAVTGIAVTGVRVFVQTLTARAWNKLVTGLLSAEEAVSQDPDVIFNGEALLSAGKQEVATSIQPEYVTVKTRDVGEYDIISEFANCPEKMRNQYNCAMDAQFAAAVRMGDAEGLTLAEAFRRGLISDKPLVSAANDPETDRRSDCYRDAYCESNLKQLRAARIVPIGWELAANLSPKKKPVTLKQAMEMFDKCGTGPGDASFPFCHLVDPNWVLKVPPMQCKAMGYSSVPLSSDVADRAETCVDMQTCLVQDDHGACADRWGYCTKEERVWRFNAESCPSYYNSCRTMTRTTDKAVFNYLTNTLDRGICNAANAGCKEYSVKRQVARCQWLAGSGTGCTAAGGCLCSSADAANCRCEGADNASLTCLVAKGGSGCTTPSGAICRLDVSACAADAGCRCVAPVSCRVAQGASSCFSTAGDDLATSDDWSPTETRFLNRKAAKCSVGDDGCSRLVSLSDGNAVNLVRNGGFEDLDDQANDGTLNHARYWMPMAAMSATAANASGSLTTQADVVSSGAHAMHVTGVSHGLTSVLSSGTACADERGCVLTDSTNGLGKCVVPFGLTSCTLKNDVHQTGLSLGAGKVYTLSAKAARGVSHASGHMEVDLLNGDGSAYTTASGDVVTSSSLYVAQDGVNFAAAGGQTCIVQGNRIMLRWDTTAKRAVASCTFSIKAGLPVKYGTVALDGYYNNTDLYFDDVMLVEGYGSVSFYEGSAANGAVFGKLPPASLGCRGEDTDPTECDQYAAVCRENEVGCESFAPTDGGTTLTGIASTNDLCPAECVGYDAFKKQASTFDAAKFPEYFIPATAQACPSTAVGCSAFTNLKTEAVSYFSGLRSCATTDDANQDVYYTWEGSDLTGYQLKTWKFKTTKDAVNADVCCYGGTCVVGSCSAAGKPDGIETAVWLKDYHADVSAGGDALTGAVGHAPCTMLGGADMDECTSRDTVNAYGSTIGYCTRADIDSGDIDCREFYDKDGNRHYRRLDKLVEVSASCDLYRIQDSTRSDCDLSGGVWNGEKNACVYRFDAVRSSVCAEENAGCRAYKGNISADVRALADDSFETTPTLWSAGTVSTESVTVGGHSLKLATAGGAASVARQLHASLRPGLSYTLSFWARGEGKVTASFASGEAFTCTASSGCAAGLCPCLDAASGLVCYINGDDDPGATTCTVSGSGAIDSLANLKFNATPIGLASEWHQYTVGPLLIPDTSSLGVDLAKVTLSFTNGGSSFFLDNFRLTENSSDFYAIAGSWKTPASCDRTVAGASSPQEMLGCREYANSQGQSAYLRSLTKLCREKAVGCAAYLDTKNSSSPYAATYNAVCRLSTACTTAMAGSGTNCPCSYQVDGATVPDACRVKVGERECRFNLDGVNFDESGRLDQSRYPDRVVVPGDSVVYLALKDAARCEEAKAGCKAMGAAQPSYEIKCSAANGTVRGSVCSLRDQAGTRVIGTCQLAAGGSSCVVSFDEPVTGSWNEVAYLDSPDSYGDNLCVEQAVGCEEYTAGGGYVYYRDPAEKVCSYQEAVMVNGETVSGFFRKSDSGSVIPCAPELLTGEKQYSMYRNADQTCQLPETGGTVMGTRYANYVSGGVCTDTIDGKCPCSVNGTFVCNVASGHSTCGYQGWAGQCVATADQCEEYVDRLATSAANPDGKPYYYRANTLDTSSCSAGASLVGGCVVLDQTSNLSKTYSAPYTYLLSQRKKGTGFVPPASCAKGDAACGKRCVSIAEGSCVCDPAKDPGCTDADDAVSCRQDSECRLTYKTDTGSATLNYGHCEGDFKYGLACTGDSDCNQGAGEKCFANGSIYSASLGAAKPVSFRTADESNLVVKARLDRQCSEWLSCESESPIWDEVAGKFKSVCTGFLSCRKAAQNGQPNECATVAKEEHTRLTNVAYQKRDTGWYGEDDSGYSVAGSYPMSYVLPVNVVPNGCVSKNDQSMPQMDGKHVKSCLVATGCTGDNMCVTFDGLCKKGDVINPDAPCRRNEECDMEGGEICARSYLATHRFGVVFEPNGSCVTKEDCVAGKFGADEDGSCVAGRCVWNYLPGTFAASNLDAAGACRAYPEKDAPYGDSVLLSGSASANETYKIENGFDIFGSPVSKKSSWAGTNVCNKANDCECDYLRVKYGTAAERFYTYPGNSSGPVVYNGLTKGVSAYESLFDYPGICVGGPNDGLRCDPSNDLGHCSADESRTCSNDAACNYKKDDATEVTDQGPCVKTCGTTEQGGRCAVWTDVSYQRGWSGFCVDHDRALNVNGAENQFACNLWLPIEQLNGAPDFSNQYKDAGFNPSQSEVGYCTVAQGNARNGSYDDEWGTAELKVSSTSLVDGLSSFGSPHAAACCSDSSYWGEAYSKLACIAMTGVESFSSNVSTTFAVASSATHLLDDRPLWVKNYYWKPPTGVTYSKGTVVGFTVKVGDRYFTISPNNNWVYSNRLEDVKPTKAPGDLSAGDPTRHLTENDRKCGCVEPWYGDKNVGAQAQFDSSGNVASVRLWYCDGTDSSTSQQFTVTALMRESCEEVYVAHDSAYGDQNFPSMAKTNAVFVSDRKKHQVTERAGSSTYSAAQKSLQPVGAVAPLAEYKEGSYFKLDINSWLPVWSSEGGSQYSMTNASNAFDDGFKTIRNDNKMTYAVAGVPFASVGPTQELGASGSFANAQASGLAKLKSLFGMVWRRFTKEVTSSFVGNYGVATIASSRFDLRVTEGVNSTAAPRVAAVVTSSCSASIDGLCTESTPADSAGGGLTINDSDGQDIVSETAGSYKATVKFYAMADKDHMPIRRMIFDYGDGKILDPNVGWFKNHRGCDQNSAVCDERSRLCDSDSQRFDLQPQACDDRFFSFVHTYRCTNTDNSYAGLPECQTDSTKNAYYPCRISAEGVCVFKPRVQVMDNWGACNGSCPNGPGGTGKACVNLGSGNAAPYQLGYDNGLRPEFMPTSDVGQASPVGNQNGLGTFEKNECVGMVGVTKGGLTYNYYSYTYKGQRYAPWTAYQGVLKVRVKY